MRPPLPNRKQGSLAAAGANMLDIGLDFNLNGTQISGLTK